MGEVGRIARDRLLAVGRAVEARSRDKGLPVGSNDLVVMR